MTSRSDGWACVRLSDGVRVAYPVGLRGALLEVYPSPDSGAMVWRLFGELTEGQRRDLVRHGWPHRPRGE